MFLLVAFVGAVVFAIFLYTHGPKLSRGRGYTRIPTVREVDSLDYSSMKPRDDRGTKDGRRESIVKRMSRIAKETDDELAP